jgi:hypothetical protein
LRTSRSIVALDRDDEQDFAHGYAHAWYVLNLERCMTVASPILEVLAEYECRYVVIGSTARALMGQPIVPRDVDIVVDGSAEWRASLVDALVALGAQFDRRPGFALIGPSTRLCWEWGWRTMTALGQIDIITKFADGTDFANHDAHAASVALPSGRSVRCRPTEHAA